MTWTVAAPAITAAFLASLVEAVEALTIVLAAASVRGWRASGTGALAGLLLLGVLLVLFGPLLSYVPLRALQIPIGILLLLFGMRWLRKAILRAAGVIALHDENAAYASTRSELNAGSSFTRTHGAFWAAWLTSFQGVLIEGLEVVFIVIAVGAGRGLMLAASAGAAAACVVVAAAGAVIHRPLARVPENTLKFVVGLMLSAFGIFWIGEGIAVPWPGADWTVVGLVLLLLAVSMTSVALARRARLSSP